jgi:hypothetical protein
MTAAILLPGPSLASLDRVPSADLVIGVKRAAVRFPCHWCAILDSPDLRSTWCDELIGRPRLLTRAAYRPKYTALPGLNVEGLAEFCPLRHDEWTSTAALVLAGFLHAGRIDVYGADFGEGDKLEEFDGFRSPEANYSPQRWQRERAAWDAVADWLKQRGTEVWRRTGDEKK